MTQNEQSKARSEDKKEEIKSFFLQEKPADMIVLLKKEERSYAGRLSEAAETTYSHAVKVMKRMKEADLVECKRRGRKKQYTLTEKGECVAETIQSMMDRIEGMECPEIRNEK